MSDLFARIFTGSKRSSLISILGAVVFGLALFKVMSLLKKDTAADYVAAVASFSKWEKSGKEEDRIKVEAIIKRQPELRTKFEALIGQRLLEQGNGEAASVFVTEVLNRTSDASSLYRQFAEISLVVGRGDLLKALEKSYQLKTSLEGHPEMQVLEGYNLLRLAFLEQEVGSPVEELKLWNELVKHDSFALIEQSIRKENLTLRNYIQHRKSNL
jgi:hypothetical protein